MKNADIVIIEDDPNIRQAMRSLLSHNGHTVTHEASSLPRAIMALDLIVAGEVKCDLITLDGNLNSNGSQDGYDARRILDEVRKYGLGVRVIGFSGSGLPVSEAEYSSVIDFDVIKPEFDQLSAAIEAL